MASEESNVTDLTLEVLKDIRGEMRGLREDTASLRADLNRGLSEVRSEITELRGEVTELRGEVTELRGEVTELREDLHDVRSAVLQLSEYTQSGFAALIGQGDRRFLDHEGRIRTLEQHVGLGRPR